MKSLIKYTLAVTLAAGATASASHHHQHRHVRKDGTNVEKRSPDVVIQYVPGPTETQFELGGKVIDAKEAEAGLKAGNYVIVGETTPSYAPPPPPAPTTSTTSQDMKAQFIESKTSSAPPPATTTSVTPSPSPKPAQQPAQPKGSLAGGGLASPFPNGVIPCNQFPSDYGAVPLDYLGLGGWTGVQNVPGYTTSDLSISTIITGISGETCGSKGVAFCSYACPDGYHKMQMPGAQGSDKQSVGGLLCNSDGFLELTRKGSNVLCGPGVGGVTIQNDLSDVVSTCGTDYPGTESMVIPTVANPGSSVPLCNPDQTSYYSWVGLPTSAQYYVNKRGLSAEAACVWNCEKDPKGCGNWAPVNIGVGRAGDGLTYISIFANAPTSTAKLDFNIEITGDVNSKCSLVNGQWSGGNGNGCTTAMRAGGQAIIRYFD